MRTVRAAPIRTAAVLIAFGLSVLGFYRLHTRTDLFASYWDIFALWTASLALYLLAVVQPWHLLSPRRLQAWLRVHHQALLDAGILLAFALLFRLPNLAHWPDVMGGDEGEIGNRARYMITDLHAHGNMFGSAWAYGLLYYLMHSLPVIALNGGPAAVRLPDAILGSLAAPLTYLAGRQLFDRRVGLIAGTLVCASAIDIVASRTAYGHALDVTLAAFVIFTFVRGLDRQDVRWLALAGLGLGMAQYVYVGSRLTDLLIASYVVALLIVDRPLVRRNLAGIAIAFGAALITAAPMIHWAITHPGDYMARANATGLTASITRGDVPMPPGTWTVIWLQQLRAAFMAPFAYPASLLYNLSVPMLDRAWATFFLVGLLYGIWQLKDRRYLLLVLHVAWGLALMTLGTYVANAAYRELGVLVSFAILAAVALLLVIDLGLGDWLRSARTRNLLAGVVVVITVGVNLHYFFFDYLPHCRYMDPGTAAASVTATYLAANANGADVFTLTEPDYRMDVYPSVEYLTHRKAWQFDQLRLNQVPEPGQPGSTGNIYVLPKATTSEQLLLRAQSSRPVVVIVSGSRATDLDAYVDRYPDGTRDTLIRCGQVIAEVYRRP
jgi:uncharacterized membrane protein